MAKVYITRTGSGATGKSATTMSGGATKHLIYKGPTLGYIYDYSTAVTGTAQYVIEDGPTIGRKLSPT